MKVKFYKDEWYPVYVEDAGTFTQELEITEEQYKRYKKAYKEFSKIQDELRRIDHATNA